MSNTPNAIAPVSESNYEPILVPEGTHFARVFKIIDLGTHPTEYQGDPKGDFRLFHISFEFPKITHVFKEEKGEQPLARSKQVKFTITPKEATNQSFLTRLALACGHNPHDKPLNIFSLLGEPLQVSIAHKESSNGRVYDNIKNFTALSAEQKEIVQIKEKEYAQVNDSTFLYLEPEHFNGAVYEALPDFLKEEIKKSPEWKILKDEPVEETQTTS